MSRTSYLRRPLTALLMGAVGAALAASVVIAAVVLASPAWAATYTVIIRRGATYKAVVSTVAKDVAGNRLDQDGSTAGLQQKVWFFEID
jgi:hypothetical protein